MKPKILVVDDEPNSLKLIRDYLSDSDVEIIEAEDGNQAWKILEKSHKEIDLILLDRMMPNMDGMEVMAKIKEHPDIARIPVIMQTAAGTTEEIIEGVQAGVYYYLLKPYSCDILISFVTAALKNHETDTSLRQGLSENKHTLHFIENYQLSYQTPSDTQNLCAHIANFYPDPESVLAGISELLINAVVHGNMGITFDEKTELLKTNRWSEEIERRQELPEYKNRKVQVSYMKTNSEIILTIEDEGNGFDWENYLNLPPETLMSPNGRGIYMCKNIYFDRLDYIGKGNIVRATTYLKR